MSTRVRIIITTITVPVVFILISLASPQLAGLGNSSALIPPLALMIIEMFLMAWVVNFKLKGERLFSVLMFPALSLAILVGFIDILILSYEKTLDKLTIILLAAAIIAALTYILTASMNILNLAAIRNVPLGQAGRAAHYVLTMIFSYLTFVLLVSFEAGLAIKLALTFAFIFTYTFAALWTIGLQYSQRVVSSLGISFLLVFVFFILSIWPLQTFFFALFMTFLYYMCLGVALELREIIRNWIWYEYLAIFVVMILILLTTASWGINGTII